ncbi:MAG: hypothetical protein LBG30_07200 [Odoribacteraceae bacterium]|nr:hypothetical protein [Odoribacteraceae bacterium]
MEEPVLMSRNKQDYPPMHTVEHILNQTMTRMFGCPRSGKAHVERRKGRCDYALGAAPAEGDIREVERRVNEVIGRCLPVEISFADRDLLPPGVDAGKLPGGVVGAVRVVRIGDYDVCACSGAHVRNTGEIGRFKVVSYDYSAPVLRLRFKLEES